MIAMLPAMPGDSKDLLDPKTPGQTKTLPNLPSGSNTAALPDFASWVTKALAGLPETGDHAKSTKDKSDAKSTTSDKIDKSSDLLTPDAATNVGAEPPPLSTPAPPPKLGGHSTTALHHTLGDATSKRADTQSEASAPATNGKDSAPARIAIKPPLPEIAPKSLFETAGKAGAKTDGMAVAQSEEPMKFTAEQNKIAGQATQKLPPVAPISSAAAVKADSATAKIRLPIEFSNRDNAVEQLALNSAKAASTPATVSAVSAVHAPSAVDRVEQMVTREAISFKRSGADEIGVSLKIDAHTQLFLQLSYRDGQTQALLRCEKGDLPALSAHFGQLQESLARQNIQLQSSNNASDLGRQGSSGKSRQDSAPFEESLVKNENKSAASTKPKTKPVSRRGWESWA